MIGVIFQYGSEIVEVKVDGSNCFFKTSSSMKESTIEGIKLDKPGVIKEFPDLKEDENWKQKSIKRFKENLKKMKTENERIKYIINDLIKHGYKPLYLQKQGFRSVKL